jgi:membrane associated rhomboid family serine protease
MFLHASPWHIIANMWALWIFGDNIEGYLGHFRYLVLYFVSGIAAGVLHVLFNQGSQIPTVGASGAIAGIMGAYFLLFPSSRVLTVVPFVFMFVWLPAWVVLGYWFLAQFLTGAATSIGQSASAAGGVAVWAHVGGFIAGVTLIKLFPARSQAKYSYSR